MPKPLEGVITTEQRDSFRILNFIFHIIQINADGDAELICLDEVELHTKQRNFFIERLKEIAEGTQFVFLQDAVFLRERCEAILSNQEHFVECSKQLASDFAHRHTRSMSPGVFVVAVVEYLAESHHWEKMVFLVKMDGQPSFTYKYKEIENRRIAIVDEVQNSLNENKKSIQKWALVEISDRHAWDVLAFDRINKDIGDYFKGFLGVIERQQDSVLTKTAHQAVKRWAKAIPFISLPENEDVNTYSTRAFNYLSDNDTFDTDTFIKTVVKDIDLDRKNHFMAQLRSELENVGVAGQVFTPRPDSIPKKQKRSVYVTSEGVRLEWVGDRESVGIEFGKLPNGNTRITIETANIAARG